VRKRNVRVNKEDSREKISTTTLISEPAGTVIALNIIKYKKRMPDSVSPQPALALSLPFKVASPPHSSLCPSFNYHKHAHGPEVPIKWRRKQRKDGKSLKQRDLQKITKRILNDPIMRKRDKRFLSGVQIHVLKPSLRVHVKRDAGKANGSRFYRPLLLLFLFRT